MRKPPIIAKVILNDEQIKHKLELGCDGMELQLYEELYVNETDNFVKPWGKVVNVYQLAKYPIVSVHIPLRKQGTDVLVEYLLQPLMQKQFENVCSLANAIGSRRQKPVLVVIHNENTHSTLSNMGILDSITLYIGGVLKKYPFVDLGIENLMPIAPNGSNGYSINSDFGFSSITLAKYMRNKLGTHRVGTVLDTCHAIGTGRTLIELEKIIHEDGHREFTDILTGIMSNSGGICKEIHLGNAYGLGIQSCDHGMPFVTANCEKLLELILDNYRIHKLNCPICIEIQEKDYNNCISYASTKKQVEAYFNKSNPVEEIGGSVLK